MYTARLANTVSYVETLGNFCHTVAAGLLNQLRGNHGHLKNTVVLRFRRVD